jgi:phenylacetate-CoA ligase
MPASERRHILVRLQRVTRYAWDNAPFYRRKWEEAGFHPDQLRSLEDFESKVPVIGKKDLRDAQSRVPPFGDYLCIPDHEIHHIHGTSGTTGRPTAFASAAGTGTRSRTRTPASCGRWASARATRWWSARS